jgi:hypothetical protein
MADHPKLRLSEANFPTDFNLSQPLTILGGGVHIYDDPYQVIPIESRTIREPYHAASALLLSVSLTRSTNVIHDFMHSFSNPFY